MECSRVIYTIMIISINLYIQYIWSWSMIMQLFCRCIKTDPNRNRSVSYRTSSFVNRFTPKYLNIYPDVSSHKYLWHDCEVLVMINDKSAPAYQLMQCTSQTLPAGWIRPHCDPLCYKGVMFRNDSAGCGKTGVLYVNDSALSFALFFPAFHILDCCSFSKKSPITRYST